MEDQQFIGSYKILKRIGAGGMARVYLAVHQDVPNLKVVLKVLTNPRMVERFRQEADKLALLDANPNICRIKHFFNHGDDFVIAMDYVDGDTLEDILKTKGKLPCAEACRIMISVLEVLKTAHEKDISHRDIKTSNIMIDKGGHVKVIDFGIAKGKSDPNLTIAGTAAGTPAYMAPEQFIGAIDVDYRLVDIYAVGTTLYNLLTGEPPFKGDNQFVIRDAKLTQDPVNPAKVNPDIPKKLDAVIMKAMAREPGDRYQTVQELIEALAPMCGGAEPIKHKPTGETMAAAKEDIKPIEVKPVVSAKKKSKLLPIGIAAAAIIIVIMIVALWPSGGGQETLSPDIDELTEETVVESVPSTGLLKLAIIPSGDFYLDEMLIGSGITDTSLESDTGTHYIRVENTGAVNKVLYDTVYLSKGETLPRRYTFEIAAVEEQKKEPEPKTKPVATGGKVLVGSRPRNADIYIDGKLQEQQTPYTFTLSTGRHIVRINVEYNGRMFDYVDTVQVTGDGSHRVFFNAGE